MRRNSDVDDGLVVLSCVSRTICTPRHATPRHATPRHATPRYGMERNGMDELRVSLFCIYPPRWSFFLLLLSQLTFFFFSSVFVSLVGGFSVWFFFP
jgi:hypothetical protein